MNRDVSLTLDVFNLFDRKANDVEYYNASRLRREPLQGWKTSISIGLEPRSVRLTLAARF